MRNINIVGNQYLVTVNEYTVILQCDENNYYGISEITNGEAWCGNPVILFNTFEEAEKHIIDNSLSLYVGLPIEF